MKRSFKYFAGAIFALAAVNAHASDEVVFAVPGLIMPDLPVHYAVDLGFLEKEGINATILQADRRDLATLAVISGDAIASVTDPAEASLAFSRGANLKAIVGLAINAPPFLVGDDTVTLDQESWKGKTAALFTPPNTLYTLFMRELASGGWEEVETHVYRKDASDTPDQYLRVSLGRRGTELAALLADRANLTVIHEPEASTAQLRGGKVKLRAFSNDFEQMLWTTLNTSGEAIEANPDLVERIVRGMNAALVDMQANPEKVGEFATTVYKNADPDVVSAAVQDLLAAGVFPANCMMSEVGWESNVELLRLTNPDSAALGVAFADISDLSFCKKVLATQ